MRHAKVVGNSLHRTFLAHRRAEVGSVERGNGAAVLGDKPPQTCGAASENGERIVQIVPFASDRMALTFAPSGI